MVRKALLLLACLLALGLWAGCAARGPGRDEAGTDITFFVGSDPHYKAEPDRDALRTDTVRRMNALPGSVWPEALGGGPIARPRGVLMLGDLVDDGQRPTTKAQWERFVADFGLNGRGGLLKVPVYEGWGNHDGPPGGIVQSAIRQRNTRRAGLVHVSENGLHYAWDWGGVHFVQLNLYPGNAPDPTTHYNPVWHHPQDSLDFLRADLARHVGTSGRPVVLAHHYDLQGTDWWSDAERETYCDAIKDYNVVAIFHGHTGTGIYTWKGITVVNTGNTGTGFFVCRITDDRLIAGYTLSDGTWRHTLSKPLAAQGSAARSTTP